MTSHMTSHMCPETGNVKEEGETLDTTRVHGPQSGLECVNPPNPLTEKKLSKRGPCRDASHQGVFSWTKGVCGCGRVEKRSPTHGG